MIGSNTSRTCAICNIYFILFLKKNSSCDKSSFIFIFLREKMQKEISFLSVSKNWTGSDRDTLKISLF